MTLPVTEFPIATKPLPNFVSMDTDQGAPAPNKAIARNNIGLGNVDNTSDIGKPLSTLTKAYVDGQVGPVSVTASNAYAIAAAAQAAAALANTAAASKVASLTAGINIALGGTATNPIINAIIPAFPTLTLQDTRDSLTNLNIAATTKAMYVLGRATTTDQGYGKLIRVATQPTHSAKVRSLDRFLPDGTTDNTNGGWWAYDFDQFPAIRFRWFNSDNTAAGNTNALREAALQGVGSNGYQIEMPPGGVSFLGGVLFTKNGQRLIGAGNGVTVLVFSPTVSGEIFLNWAQAGVPQGPVYCGLQDLTIIRGGTNPTYGAIAVQTCNTSIFPMHRVYIAAWYGSVAGNHIGYIHRGREFTTLQDVVIGSDLPILIGTNPDRAVVADIDCDFLAIHRGHFFASNSGGLATTGNVIQVEDGINLTNFSMRDYDLIGGLSGLYWITTVDNVCQSQSRASAGALVLNGSKAGSTFVPARKMFIYSDSNNSGVNFTFNGTLNGTAQSETIAGPVGSLVKTTKLWSTVTSISTSAATVGNVSIGQTAEGTGGNFGFAMQDGRREGVAPGGLHLLISRANCTQFNSIRMDNILDQYALVAVYGNISQVTLNNLFQTGSTQPPISADASVSGLQWTNCQFSPTASSAIPGQNTVFGVDWRAGEPLPRSGMAIPTSVGLNTAIMMTLPTSNPGGTNRLWRNGNVVNIT